MKSKPTHDFICLFLTGVYISLIGIQIIILPQWLDSKIQLSDLWFLFMLSYTAYRWQIFKPVFLELCSLRVFQYFIIVSTLYLFSNSLSVYLNPSNSGWSECLGKFYLITMTIIVLLMIYSQPLQMLINCFIICGLILSLTGTIGWISSILGFQNITTQIYLDYPYFGDTHRLNAFTTTPSMYVSLISICILFLIYYYRYIHQSWIALTMLFLFCLSALLTFAKSCLILLAGIILLTVCKPQKNWRPQVIFFLLFVFLHVISTHFLLIKTKDVYKESLINSPFTSNEIVWSGKNYSIVGSGYYSFKKAAWFIFKGQALFGVGPGNYNQQVGLLKDSGNYPLNLPNYDPHSSYLGALAETGLVGFIVLCMLGFSIVHVIMKLPYRSDPFSYTLLILFAMIITEGISMDTLNFRHYWIVVAIMFYQYIQMRDKKEFE
jgi:hypothetical protein